MSKEHERRVLRSTFLSLKGESFVAKVFRFLKYRFRPKHPLPSPRPPHNGAYPLSASAGESVQVAVLGDWGSGNDSARRVAEEVTRLAPDYTIHLGDIYSVGARREVRRHCLGEDSHEGPGVQWPTARGSLAVPGNHEYMSGGYGFFDVFLPEMGVMSGIAGAPIRQETSYFCLDIGDWRLIGLDTGCRSIHFAGAELMIA